MLLGMVLSTLNASPPPGDQIKLQAMVQNVVSIKPAAQARAPLRVQAPFTWANGPTLPK